MSTQSEDAILNVKINGSDAISTFQQLNQLRKEQITLVKNLNENSPQYDQQIQKLNQLNGVYDTWKQKIYAVGEANKGFFADWKKGFDEVEQIAAGVTIGTIISQSIRGVIDTVKELWNGAQEAYTSLVKANAQVDATLKSTNDVSGETKKGLDAMSKSYSDLYGIQDKVITKSEGVLLEFTNVRGTIYDKALPAIIDMTAAMHQGNVTMDTIESTTRLVGKALDDPIKGITQLGRLTGQFSDQQKTQIKNYVDSNQMMKAQGVILDQLQKKFGGNEKLVSDSDIGTLQKMDTALDGVSERLGKWITAGKAAAANFLLPFIKNAADARTESEKLTDSFNEQAEKVKGLTENVEPLLTKYDSLRSRWDLTQSEQAELHETINQIATDMPNAVTQWDKYGNALDINTGKAREFIKQQRAMMSILNKDAIDRTNDEINEMAGKREQLREQLNSGKITKPVQKTDIASGTSYISYENRQMTPEEIAAMVRQLKDLNAQIDTARAGVEGLEGKGIGNTKPTTPPATSGPTQAEKDAAAKKAAEIKAANLKAFQDLAEQHDQFEAAELADTESKNDKEVQVLINSYNKQITAQQNFLKRKGITEAEADATHNTIVNLGIEKAEAIGQLKLKQEKDLTDKIAALRDKLNGKVETQLQQETDEINAQFDQIAKDASQDAATQLQIETSRQAALTDAKLREEKRFQTEKDKIDSGIDVSDANRIKERINKINQAADEEITALKAKYSKELQATKAFHDAVDAINSKRKKDIAAVTTEDPIAIKKKESDEEIRITKTTADTVFSITNRNRETTANAEVQSLEDKKNAELSNVNLTAAQRKAIEDKYAKEEAEVKLKAWKADQEAAIAQAIINGALAMTKVASQTGILSFAFDPIIAAETLAQVALIATQKAPQFADGGWLPSGPSHSAGGLNVMDPLGRLVANIEGGEPILSRATASANPNLVNALLGSGGQTLNYERILSATSSRAASPQYASANTTRTRSASSGQQVTADHIAEMKAMYAQALGLIVATDKKPVVLSNRVVDDSNSKMVQIHNAVDG